MHKPQDSIKEGYEVAEMNVGVITVFVGGMFVLLFGSVATILMVERGFEESRAPLNTVSASALATADMQIPDTPHLQMDPVADRKTIKKANAAQINSYGVVSADPAMKRSHIPVNKAMKRLAAGHGTYRQAPTTEQEASAVQ